MIRDSIRDTNGFSFPEYRSSCPVYGYLNRPVLASTRLWKTSIKINHTAKRNLTEKPPERKNVLTELAPPFAKQHDPG